MRWNRVFYRYLIYIAFSFYGVSRAFCIDITQVEDGFRWRDSRLLDSAKLSGMDLPVGILSDHKEMNALESIISHSLPNVLDKR